MPCCLKTKIAPMIAAVALAVPALAWQGSVQPVDPVVDGILTQLEARQVDDLVADLQWELEYPAEEDVDTKTGQVWFKEMDPVARFRAHFTKKNFGKRRVKINEEHIFDGRWYRMIQHDTKSIETREIRREGDTIQPYRLGEGAFPLPFGQKKADILREFDVRLADATDKDPKNTHHLVLTPRPGMQMAPHYKQVDFWVEQQGKLAGLPTQVRVASLQGGGQVKNFITVTFSNVKLNRGLSPSKFDFKVPGGYEEEVTRLEPAAEIRLGGDAQP